MDVTIDDWTKAFADLRKRIPRQRYARWAECLSCGKPALDHSEGQPPRKVTKEWKGCEFFGHGAFECATTNMVRLTTPMVDLKGRCWCCKQYRDAEKAKRKK